MQTTPKAPASQRSGPMLSRVAHSLYWMSLYIERAENVARLLDVNLQFLLDFPGLNESLPQEHWASILASSDGAGLFAELHGTADSRGVTEFLAFDQRNPNSILSCVLSARENARMIRDQISSEMWEVINELYLFLRARNAVDVWRAGPYEFFQQVKRYSHQFQGLTASTFPRNEGWDFIQFGKLIERADKTTRILDVKYHILLPTATDVGGAVDTAQWHAVLRSASALDAYRRCYVHEILPWKVADFLIFSDSFPRSLCYCVDRLDGYLHRILGESPARPRPPAAVAAHDLLADLKSRDIQYVLQMGLHEFLLEVQKSLDRIGDEVVQTTMFFPTDLEPEEHQHQQTQQQQQA
jgi:uncharacterized alpha-E superfamily protein